MSVIYIILALLSLPILLFIFNPSWQLGGIGLLLGFIGMFISPITLLLLAVLLIRHFAKHKNSPEG